METTTATRVEGLQKGFGWNLHLESVNIEDRLLLKQDFAGLVLMLDPDSCGGLWGPIIVRSFAENIQHPLNRLGALNCAKLGGRK